MSSEIMSLDMWVHGEWRAGSTGELVEVVNPAKGELLATVPDGGQEDLDAAIESAHQGLAEWRETHPRTRSQILYKMAAALQERAQEFAEIYSLNSGGSVGTGLWTMYDVAGRRLEYYAGLADKIRGDTFVAPGDSLSYTLREPVDFNPVDDPDVGSYFARLPEDDYLPTWYALRMVPALAADQWPDQHAARWPMRCRAPAGCGRRPGAGRLGRSRIRRSRT